MNSFLLRFAKRLHDWFNAKWIDGKYHSTTVVSNCQLGKKVKVGKHSYCGNSSIGDFSYLSGLNIVVNTQIGKFCSIGSFVSICTGNHPTSSFVSTSPVFYSLHGYTFADKEYFKESGTVEIGNDVWIGSNVVVVDNIKIGHGAIVAAGAVVTQDVPDYAIVGGIPARLIRMRFDEETVEKLLASEWWNKDEKWLKENFKLLHNVDTFLSALEK
ncbi:MAG: CatB-related O-acetyltransferase [Bacteroidota bacterium]